MTQRVQIFNHTFGIDSLESAKSSRTGIIYMVKKETSKLGHTPLLCTKLTFFYCMTSVYIGIFCIYLLILLFVYDILICLPTVYLIYILSLLSFFLKIQ